ncbi:hypothetical protein BRL53_05205 [Corynebacterium ulcerans]|uniref:SCO6880 family protein n=1 Tax=Corynebacterium ulcerans TaxID=65058 RepID=UPI000C785B00|nr:SCO6880 family protein [Corynebacterium ulcerans]PLW00132.1 hypothetical protein BRL53_05205 [Corynebacterium ulcerans]
MAKDETLVPQFSLGQPPTRTGLGGLPMTTTVIIAVGFFLFLFAQLVGQGPFGFLVILPVTGLVALIVTVQWANRSLATTMRMVIQHASRKSAREDYYLSGENSRVPGGCHRLPGVLARTYCVSGVDSDNQPFAAIVDRPARTATVAFDVQLTGQTPMTQQERNAKTAEWSRWLSLLSLSGDIESAVTVVAVRPGTGQLVAQEVESIVVEGVPQVAAQVLHEAGQVLSSGVPEILTHIAVTIKIDGDALTDGSFMDQLATRLPGLYRSLSWAGMIASPMDEEALVGRIHGFYNPASEADFEVLEIAGLRHDLPWQEAGPGFAHHAADHYAHEGCTSVTWEMKDAPRSTFEDTLLTGLLAPHPRIQRKRVALVYRPIEAGKGVSRVESEHRDALVAANSSKKIRSANAELRLEHTDAARRAQARGAQLGLYSLFVTATAAPDEDLERIKHDVQQLGAGASVRLSLMNRQHDTGFVASCGVGQLPWAKETIAPAKSLA